MGRSLMNYNCWSFELVRQRPAGVCVLKRVGKTPESGGGLIYIIIDCQQLDRLNK